MSAASITVPKLTSPWMTMMPPWSAKPHASITFQRRFGMNSAALSAYSTTRTLHVKSVTNVPLARATRIAGASHAGAPNVGWRSQ